MVTATSRPHVKALFNELHVRLKAAGEVHSKAEGLELGWWVLIDYGDVVVHIMLPEERDRYRLDSLWGDAGLTEYSETGEAHRVRETVLADPETEEEV